MQKVIIGLRMALEMAVGLGINLLILGSLFSESTRENVMVFTQWACEWAMGHGPWAILAVSWVVVDCLDSCWQFNYATYKAKGINRQWINLIQIKYPYRNQKWLKPICVISAWAIISLWIF